MDEEPGGATSEVATGRAPGPTEEIADLPWDDDLPVALGEDWEVEEPPAGSERSRPIGDLDASGTDAEGSPTDETAVGGDETDVGADASEGAEDDAADLGALDDEDRIAGRRNALPRRVESWRSRSATGAIATALAMGLQQVFEPEKRRPAAVAEAPSNPYDDDDPITVDYVPDDAPSTTVRVKPWLLEKGEPS